MSYFGAFLARDLVAAPFTLDTPIPRLGRALWLYLLLVLRANRLGFVCRTQASLGRDLGVLDDVVAAWIAKLEKAKLVSVENPAPYLVIKLRFWPGKTLEQSEPSIESTEQSSDSPSSVPVSAASNAEDRQDRIASKAEDGGVGEGENLLEEALATLETPATPAFEHLIAQHPAELVRRALYRVRITPPGEIRRSKLALFRYLLAKFSAESHDRHPPH